MIRRERKEEWFIENSGKRVGPLKLEEIQQRLSSGNLLPNDRVFREDAAESDCTISELIRTESDPTYSLFDTLRAALEKSAALAKRDLPALDHSITPDSFESFFRPKNIVFMCLGISVLVGGYYWLNSSPEKEENSEPRVASVRSTTSSSNSPNSNSPSSGNSGSSLAGSSANTSATSRSISSENKLDIKIKQGLPNAAQNLTPQNSTITSRPITPPGVPPLPGGVPPANHHTSPDDGKTPPANDDSNHANDSNADINPYANDGAYDPNSDLNRNEPYNNDPSGMDRAYEQPNSTD